MNNLRVDVILESEQRSASPVGIKVVGRIAGIGLGAVVLMLILSFVVRVTYARSERDGLKKNWDSLSPILEKVKEYQGEVRANKDLLDGIKGWNRSRMSWHGHLSDFQNTVPGEIQITSLQASEQVLMQGSTPALVVMMDLRGIAVGRDPESAVKAVERLGSVMKSASGFSNLVENTDIESCDEVPGEQNQRTFRMKAKYLPRSF